MLRAPVLAVLLWAASVPGCAREGIPAADPEMPESVERARATWPAGLEALIDSAAAAYGDEEFERASALFRRATGTAPELATAWFGVYIAEHARGRTAAADSALRQALELTGRARR